MITFFTKNLIWTEGIYVLYALGFLLFFATFFFRRLKWLAVGLLVFSFYFFRNPDRVCRQALYDPSLLICPADGKVVDMQYDKNGKFEGYEQKVSIFLSPLDVHVQWMPVAGTVKKVAYKEGEFAMAFLPKSSEKNERNDVVMETEQGKTILVRQIAGTIARRICCWTKEGEHVDRGEKFGMIRFGSRVDVFLPKEVLLSIGVGQKVYGGKTVLGRWNWQGLGKAS